MGERKIEQRGGEPKVQDEAWSADVSRALLWPLDAKGREAVRTRVPGPPEVWGLHRQMG